MNKIKWSAVSAPICVIALLVLSQIVMAGSTLDQGNLDIARGDTASGEARSNHAGPGLPIVSTDNWPKRPGTSTTANTGPTSSNALGMSPDADPTLVAHFMMEEGGGGTILDSSDYGNHGALSGNPTWEYGYYGLVLDLDGLGDYAVVPDDPSLDVENEITLAAWVKPRASDAQSLITKVDTGTKSGYTLFLRSNDLVSVKFNHSNKLLVTSDTNYWTASNGGTDWIHVAATYDGATIRLYINGVQDPNSLSSSFTIETHTQSLSIGAETDGTGPLNGQMDEVRIYNRALSLAEIEALATLPPADTADLSITKDDGQTTATPGDPVAYTIIVSNSGPDYVLDATVTDTFPADLTGVTWTCTASAGASCAASGSGDINESVDLMYSNSVTYTVNATFDAGATDALINTASVALPAGMTDPDPDNNSATDLDLPSPWADRCGPDPSLVGCWLMEEAGGVTIYDSSGYGNHGTLYNDATRLAGQPGWGQALALDGTGDYALVPDDNSLDLDTSLTIASWVKPEKAGTQDLVKKAIMDGTGGYEMALAPDPSAVPPEGDGRPYGRLDQLTYGNTYRINALTQYPVSGSDWIHLAVTYDGVNLRLYYDGILESTLPAAIPIPTNTLPLGIGAQSDGAREFQGQMDEVRVYNRALSLAEIEALAGLSPWRTADLAITKDDGLATADPGDPVTYTLSVTNDGPDDVIGAIVTDTFPLALTGVTWTCTAAGGASCTASGSGDISDIIDLSSGSSVIYTVNATFDAGASGEVSNTASVTPPARVNDPDTGNNSATDVTDLGTQPITNYALDFDGSDDYVTFGAAPGLGLSTFTIETWFKREGDGIAVSSGFGGLTGPDIAIPLVTKGRAQTDGSNLDMNYFLGIRDSDNVLAADFEDMATGANHPVLGVTPIINHGWYHAAVTYDGTTWRLYLNGQLETEQTENATPRWDSIQHAGLATAMTSSGAAAGYFDGVLDEVRIWNYARTQQQIVDNLGLEITSDTGLIARWGLNEGAGTNVGDSSGSDIGGTTTNGPIWVSGSPFTLPTLVSFQDGVNGYSDTVDTYIQQDAPALPHGTETEVSWVQSVGAAPNTEKVGLVRFENIFDSEGGPIPVGSTILTSTLVYFVHDPGTDDNDADVSNVLVDWAESVTYDDLGDQTTGLDPGVVGDFIGTADANPAGSKTLDVSSSVAAWSVDPSGNHGWILQPTAIDRSGLRSREHTTIAERPRLLVLYGSPRPSPPAAPQNLVGTAGNTVAGLSWDANVELGLAGYNVYRSETSPVPTDTTPINASPVISPSYTDSGLVNGTTYYYLVTALNSSDGESGSSNEVSVTPQELDTALDFGDADAYVTFGDPDALDLATFTIETWFKREGTGATSYTGIGGFYGIPLVTKGQAEFDGNNTDMNYFLGICDSAGGVLCADFEEGADGTSPGLNHPVYGITAILTDTWYHAAATYDGTTWQLYLDGNWEGESTVGEPPRSDSIQHAALGTAIDSLGVPEGHFDGVLDEVRIWDYGRTHYDIRDTVNVEITFSPPGLVARWGLDEGAGTLVHSTPLPSVDGDVTSSGWSWPPGAPFDINLAPDTPSSPSPGDSAAGVGSDPELMAYVSDPEGDPLTVTFYGREATVPSGENFTLVALPDTQYYTVNPGGDAIFNAQTQWISDTQATRNIVFVSHLGDVTQNGDADLDDSEWAIADAAMGILENSPAFSDGIPYGITPGNHDAISGTTNYEDWFGVSRFSGRSYYGGHYGLDNLNNYETFSASGMDFIVLNIDCSDYNDPPPTAVLDWADALLKADPARRGIVGCHHILSGSAFTVSGQAIYEALKDNPNLFLMMGGHMDIAGRRSDTYNGNTVYSLRSDYQSLEGGQGWLRIMEFQPASDRIEVTTYSPYLDQQWDPGDNTNNFTLSYDMLGDFTLIGTNEAVPSGSTTTMTWSDREPGTEYEWYVTVSDGAKTTIGPIWSFTTALSTSFDLDLSPGWNLVSWPLAPATTNLTDTLASCTACDEAWAYDARDGTDPWKQWPGDLAQVDETMGLWLHVTDTVTLPLAGGPPVTPTVELSDGWNLVGYPSRTARTVAEALLSIAGSYTRVAAFDPTNPAHPWPEYNAGLPPYASHLLLMEPGRGYWIKVTEDCTWSVEP